MLQNTMKNRRYLVHFWDEILTHQRMLYDHCPVPTSIKMDLVGLGSFERIFPTYVGPFDAIHWYYFLFKNPKKRPMDSNQKAYPVMEINFLIHLLENVRYVFFLTLCMMWILYSAHTKYSSTSSRLCKLIEYRSR